MHATKHEGAGNDFLVVLDPDDTVRLSVAQVRLLADRRRGIGADGIIRVGPGRDGCDLSMELHNADGGEAEMSGNGIRCLAQAAVRRRPRRPARLHGRHGAAVPRTVEYTPGEVPGWAKADVDMGPARLGPDQPQEFGDRRARTVDVGNPHLVLLGPDTAAVDIARARPEAPGGLHRRHQRRVDHRGARRRGRAARLRVWERGAARPWPAAPGAWPPRPRRAAGVPCAPTVTVRVRNPGGVLEVTLGVDAGATTHLAGPVRKVADIDIHPGMLS